MTTLLVLITIALGISLMLILFKANFPKLEKVIHKISFYSFIGVLSCVFLFIGHFRLKGTYTTSIIGITFIVSMILLFGLTKNTRIKRLSGTFTIPIFLILVSSIFWKTPLFVFSLISLPFEPPISKFEIDNNHNIEVRNGEFLACGERLVITKSSFGILDKQHDIGNDLCITGIYNIEALKINENITEFLIYHDGQTEFENPYKYQTEL